MHAIVIDHQSTDGTRDAALACGAEVVTRAFDGFVESRLFGLSRVQTPWTLMIDADEALDDALRASMLAVEENANGFVLKRTTFYCGRALRMWRNEPVLRLFRTQGVKLDSWPASGGSAQLHERWSCDPPVGSLDGNLLHYSYATHAEYAEKYERYTSIEARGLPASRRSAAAELARVLPRFGWYLIAKGAFADGFTGMRIAWLSALYPAVVRIKALRR